MFFSVVVLRIIVVGSLVIIDGTIWLAIGTRLILLEICLSEVVDQVYPNVISAVTEVGLINIGLLAV